MVSSSSHPRGRMGPEVGSEKKFFPRSRLWPHLAPRVGGERVIANVFRVFFFFICFSFYIKMCIYVATLKAKKLKKKRFFFSKKRFFIFKKNFFPRIYLWPHAAPKEGVVPQFFRVFFFLFCFSFYIKMCTYVGTLK